MNIEIPAQLIVREHVLVWTFALTMTFLIMIFNLPDTCGQALGVFS